MVLGRVAIDGNYAMSVGEEMRLCSAARETSIAPATHHRRRPSLGYFAKLAARNRREDDIVLGASQSSLAGGASATAFRRIFSSVDENVGRQSEREPFYVSDVSGSLDHKVYLQ